MAQFVELEAECAEPTQELFNMSDCESENNSFVVSDHESEPEEQIVVVRRRLKRKKVVIRRSLSRSESTDVKDAQIAASVPADPPLAVPPPRKRKAKQG